MTGHSHFYDIRDPVGLPITRYEVVGAGVYSSHVWSGEWTPFGELESETGDPSMRPPWGFTGQVTLAGSESRELRLNQWRVYDPEVGQYVTAEPLAVSGEAPVAHGYAYAYSSPQNYTDPSGENPLAVAVAAAEGLAALAGPFVVAACVTGLVYLIVEGGEEDHKDECAEKFSQCHDMIGDRSPRGRGSHKSICAYCMDQCIEDDGNWPFTTASGIACPSLP